MSEIRSNALSRQVVSKTRASSSSLPVVAVAESRDEPHNVERAERFDALVLDAGLRQSLVTVRSLGRRGRSVAALETLSDVPAFASRWCQRKFVFPTEHA